jgi:hypothetical protein
LPDGSFSNQKSQFGQNLEGLGMENVVRFYDNLENVSVIWYNVVYSRLVYFVVIWYIFPFWYVWTKKNLATLLIIYCGETFESQKTCSRRINSSQNHRRFFICCIFSGEKNLFLA